MAIIVIPPIAVKTPKMFLLINLPNIPAIANKTATPIIETATSPIAASMGNISFQESIFSFSAICAKNPTSTANPAIKLANTADFKNASLEIFTLPTAHIIPARGNIAAPTIQIAFSKSVILLILIFIPKSF